MKKSHLAVFVLILLSTKILPQKVELGPTLFSGISSTREESFSFDQSGLCLGGGLDLRVRITRNAYIGCDLLYDRKGYRHEIILTDHTGKPTGVYNAKSHRQYFSLPLFMNFRFGGTTKFIINAGSYFNYLYRDSFKSAAFASTNKKQTVIVPHENRFDSGLLLGLGFMTDLSSLMTFQLELRNCIGLKNVSESNVSTPLYLNSHYLFVGFNFKLGKKE